MSMSQQFAVKDGMVESHTEAKMGKGEQKRKKKWTEPAQFELRLKNGYCCIVPVCNERVEMLCIFKSGKNK